jgi:prepilin-type N-terminal cleavage/methylation domain-containing protein
MNTLNRNKGFTLIELLIVISILAILLALAVGGYLQYMRTLQFSEATQTMTNALKRTVEESTKRNQVLRFQINNQNTLVWSTQVGDVEVGRSFLPHGVRVIEQNPLGEIRITNRGLPAGQFTFTLADSRQSIFVTLLPTGMVIAR